MRISDWSSDVCSSDLENHRMYLELGLNILLIVLSLPTLVYVVLLHRRLSSLRADREAVDAVVERMNEATRRADAALRSEERRGGKECVSTCRSWCAPSQ